MGTDVLCLFGDFIEEELSLEDKILVAFADSVVSWADYTIYYNGSHCNVEAFADVCKQNVRSQFCYSLSPHLSCQAKKDAQSWIERCQMIQWHEQLRFCEYEDFRVKVYHNLIASYQRKADRVGFLRMKDLCKNIPAFICGAGPSLEEEIAAITGKEGIIFAGGAALGCLEQLHKPIHIAAGIDPAPSHGRVRLPRSFSGPFFYQPRFDATLVDEQESLRLQLPSNPGYVLEKWLEEMEPFDGGWTVTTLCTALALHLGCNPIIFVGMDLAYAQDGNIYSKVAPLPEKRQGILWREIVHTQKDWVLAAKWIEDKVAQHPSRRFYTTSKLGLSMEGVEQIRTLPSQEVTIADCMEAIQAVYAPATQGDDKIQQLQKSLHSCLEKVDKMLSLWESSYPNSPSHRGDFIIQEVELEEEIAYQCIVTPVWDVWRISIEETTCRPGTEEIRRLLFFKKVLLAYIGDGTCARVY